jgi:hypothetical protein
MTPVSPVMPGSEDIERVFGEGQPEYIGLPSVFLDQPNRPVISRWRLTEEERQAIAGGADVVLTLLTFWHPLQPVHLQVCFADQNPSLEHTL